MEYTNAKLERVENGYLVTWDEMHKGKGGDYSPMTNYNQKEVFGLDEHEDAMKCLSEKSGFGGKGEMKEEKMEEGNSHNSGHMEEEY